MNAILEAMEKRRSVRKYKPDMVSPGCHQQRDQCRPVRGKRHEQTGHHHYLRHQ